MPRHDRLWLADILNAIELISEFIRDQTYESFVSDVKTRAAVLQQLIVIGEAAARIDSIVRDANPQVNWRVMAAFRNRAVHEYFGIEWTIVWHTATVNLPVLAPLVEAALESIDPNRPER